MGPNSGDDLDSLRERQKRESDHDERIRAEQEAANWEHRCRVAELNLDTLKNHHARVNAKFAEQIKIEVANRERCQSEARDARTTCAEVAGRFAAFVRSMRSVHSKLTHGEHRTAHDQLSQAIARADETVQPVQLGERDTSVIPVAGRMLRDGSVSMTPTSSGLVIRVEDASNDEFWVELVLSHQRLLSALAQVHRLAHGDRLSG